MKRLVVLALASALALNTSAVMGTGIDLIYQKSCAMCHGSDGRGSLPGTPDFTSVSGPLGKSNAMLEHNIANGFRGLGSSFAMPARGGNPTLTDDEIALLIIYMKRRFYTYGVRNETTNQTPLL